MTAKDGSVVSLRLLLKFCLEQEAQDRMESYPSPRELEQQYPDMEHLDRRVLPAVERLRRAGKRKGHAPLRLLKRLLVVAAILISILSCILFTSAAIRSAVVNTIIDWTGRDVGIHFEIEGEPLSALPDGYGPHYIPDGFEYDAKNSLIERGIIDLSYQSADRSQVLTISANIIRNSSQNRMDNEHTEYEMITWLDTKA